MASTLIGAALISFTPTKWVQHFGVFAVLGAALLTLVVAAATEPGHWARRVAALAVLTTAAAISLTGWNIWWYLGALRMPAATHSVTLGGVGVSGIAVVLGMLAAVSQLPPVRRVAPAAGARALAGALVALVALVVGSYGAVLAEPTAPSSYSAVRAGYGGLTGNPCALENATGVELNPTLGILTPTDTSDATDGFTPLPTVPGVTSRTTTDTDTPDAAAPSTPTRPATATTTWRSVPDDVRKGLLPLVVPIAGTTSDAVTVTLQCRSSSNPDAVSDLALTNTTSYVFDHRLDLAAQAPGADQVRVLSNDADAAPGRWIETRTPRAPVITSLRDLNPPQIPTAVDWRSSFFLACTQPTAEANGITTPPTYLVTSENGTDNPAGTASLGFDSRAGGGYYTLGAISTLVPLPTYLLGAPTDDWIRVYQVRPRWNGQPKSTTSDLPTSGITAGPRVVVPR